MLTRDKRKTFPAGQDALLPVPKVTPYTDDHSSLSL